MTNQPDELAPPSEPDRRQAVRHAEVALRSIGQPNSVAGEFDFWNDRYEGRRLFSELLGTFGACQEFMVRPATMVMLTGLDGKG